MLGVTVAGWGATIGLVVLLFAFDLLVAGRRPHAVGLREAVRWAAGYVAVALLFGVVFGSIAGWKFGAQYIAGYVVEWSLSVDNLFVFVIIMSTFAVPAQHQQKVLTLGILLALIFRGVFIALGATLLDAFSFMFLIFGLALLATALQLVRHRNEDPSVQDNALVSIARRRLPFTDRYQEGRLFGRVQGRRVLTPLFLVLVAIGSTDLLFALDSIPAIFGISREAFIVFAANAFALLGLRALFFLVSGLLDRLVYLSTGLALILAFVGVKLMLHFAHTQAHGWPEISTALSLVVIVVILGVTTAASLVRSRSAPDARAHPGAVRGHPRGGAGGRRPRGGAERPTATGDPGPPEG
jgi:TerC family integral membrane protein